MDKKGNLGNVAMLGCMRCQKEFAIVMQTTEGPDQFKGQKVVYDGSSICEDCQKLWDDALTATAPFEWSNLKETMWWQ